MATQMKAPYREQGRALVKAMERYGDSGIGPAKLAQKAWPRDPKWAERRIWAARYGHSLLPDGLREKIADVFGTPERDFLPHDVTTVPLIRRKRSSGRGEVAAVPEEESMPVVEEGSGDERPRGRPRRCTLRSLLPQDSPEGILPMLTTEMGPDDPEAQADLLMKLADHLDQDDLLSAVMQRRVSNALPRVLARLERATVPSRDDTVTEPRTRRESHVPAAGPAEQGSLPETSCPLNLEEGTLVSLLAGARPALVYYAPDHCVIRVEKRISPDLAAFLGAQYRA